MEMFKVKLTGETIDLDNLDNRYYQEKDLSKFWAELKLDCYYQLGYALIYMDYIYEDIDWRDQRDRIDVLIEELKTNRTNDDKMYWLKFLFKIKDEIENLC